MKTYLAGAIRGPEDYFWRQAIRTLYPGLQCLIPSDIGVDASKLRNRGGSAYMTFRTDLDLIDKADMVLVNLLALDDGYPCLGTLFELGYAHARGKHILIVCSEATRTHPFIAFGGAGVFTSFDEMGGYLKKYLKVTDGTIEIHQTGNGIVGHPKLTIGRI